jgi:isopenicillin N synthase-like dioxygenase
MPLAVRVSIDHRYDPTQRFSVGFRDKSTSEWFDEKCYFHYHRVLLTLDEHRDNPSYQIFLSAMSHVYDELDLLVHSIGDALIEGWYMETESFYADDRSTNSNLRILQYRPQESCRYLAKPHTDRGIFTLTVYETDPGLRFYLPDGAIQPVEYEEFVVKMFPMDFWSKYVSLPLPATTHDVVKQWGDTERGSMVLFVNPAYGKWPYWEDETITEY